MAAEAVEALNADQAPEAPLPVLEEPKQAERVAYSDRVGRPFGRALRSGGDETEIDQRDLGTVEIVREIGPDAGMEAPAMDEHEMHSGFTPPALGAACRRSRARPKGDRYRSLDAPR